MEKPRKIDINRRKARGVLFLIASFVAPSVQIPVFCQASPLGSPGKKFKNSGRSQWACLAKNRYLDRWGNEAGNQKERLFGPP